MGSFVINSFFVHMKWIDQYILFYFDEIMRYIIFIFVYKIFGKNAITFKHVRFN